MYDWTRGYFKDFKDVDWTALEYDGVDFPETPIPLEREEHRLFRYAHPQKVNPPTMDHPTRGILQANSGANRSKGSGDGGYGSAYEGKTFGVKWRDGQGYMSNENYYLMAEDLRPVFKLATEILLTPASLDFLYDVIWSPRTRDSGATLPNVRPAETIVPKARKTEKNRADVRAALERLAVSLSWRLEQLSDEYALILPVLWDHQNGVCIRDDNGSHLGVASVIRINQYLLTQLKKLGENPHTDPDTGTARLFSLRFKIAQTLCHETVHAVNYAVDSDALQAEHDKGAGLVGLECPEPYYGTENVAELGHSWEQHVFNGSISVENSIDYCFTHSTWPNYVRCRNSWPIKGGVYRNATKYFVPLKYIRNLNSSAFWTHHGKRDGSMLRIARRIGFVDTSYGDNILSNSYLLDGGVDPDNPGSLVDPQATWRVRRAGAPDIEPSEFDANTWDPPPPRGRDSNDSDNGNDDDGEEGGSGSSRGQQGSSHDTLSGPAENRDDGTKRSKGRRSIGTRPGKGKQPESRERKDAGDQRSEARRTSQTPDVGVPDEQVGKGPSREKGNKTSAVKEGKKLRRRGQMKSAAPTQDEDVPGGKAAEVPPKKRSRVTEKVQEEQEPQRRSGRNQDRVDYGLSSYNRF